MNLQDNKHELMEFHWMTVLLQNIDAGIVVLNRDYQVQVWNTFMENHSGIHPQEVRNKNLFQVVPDIPEQWFKRKCEAVFQLKHHSFNTWQERPYLIEFMNYRPITHPERSMYQNFTIFPISGLNGETDFIAIIIYDVTDVALGKKQLEHSNKALTQQSRTDQLTSLFNRCYWEQRVEQEFERFKRYRSPATLIMLDIDHFKQVNDTFGHLFGDEVIRQLAKMINQLKRNTDIAGRYGGEEFGILLVDTNSENASIFAERLRKKVESCVVEYGGKRLNFTISLGMAEFCDPVDSHEIILNMADEALYESKTNGRNQSTIYQSAPVEAEQNALVS